MATGKAEVSGFNLQLLESCELYGGSILLVNAIRMGITCSVTLPLWNNGDRVHNVRLFESAFPGYWYLPAVLGWCHQYAPEDISSRRTYYQFFSIDYLDGDTPLFDFELGFQVQILGSSKV